jgi:4-oxalocrotonate tautomerase
VPLVQISLAAGRSSQQIRSLISEITAAVVRSVDAPLGNVRVIVTEVPPGNWAAGDVTLDERAGAARK